jgi:FAD binding domain
LKPPLYETTLWGMGIASGVELRHFFNSRQNLSSFVYVTRRVLHHAWRYLIHGRGTHLVNGNALVAGLLRSALDLKIDLRLNSPVVRLLRQNTADGQRVSGAVLQGPQGRYEIQTRCGVVLATGGFPHDQERLKTLLPHARGQAKAQHWSAGARSNTGDGLRLGESQGGVVNTQGQQGAALAPVSLVPRADGSRT